jgi:hypothetical protein
LASRQITYGDPPTRVPALDIAELDWDVSLHFIGAFT